MPSQATWADVIAEASDLLSELVGTDLIPPEFEEQAAGLARDLADIAFELRQG
jgi:hypothetical protein